MEEITNSIKNMSINDKITNIEKLFFKLQIKTEYYGILLIHKKQYINFKTLNVVLSANRKIRIFNLNKKIDILKKIKKFFYIESDMIINIFIQQFNNIKLYVIEINNNYPIHIKDNTTISRWFYNQDNYKCNIELKFEFVDKIININKTNKKYLLKLHNNIDCSKLQYNCKNLKEINNICEHNRIIKKKRKRDYNCDELQKILKKKKNYTYYYIDNNNDYKQDYIKKKKQIKYKNKLIIKKSSQFKKYIINPKQFNSIKFNDILFN